MIKFLISGSYHDEADNITYFQTFEHSVSESIDPVSLLHYIGDQITPKYQEGFNNVQRIEVIE